jgi:hypothetical protein
MVRKVHVCRRSIDDFDPLRGLGTSISGNMTRLRQLRHSALAVLLAAGTLRCSESTEPTTASVIETAGGNEQVGIVGLQLANPLVVLVTDQDGDPVEGVSVRWDSQGAGSVSAETVETGSDGRASVTRVLGPEPGEQMTTASVDGLEGSPVTFVATAIEGSGEGGIVITTNPPVSALSGEVFDPVVQPVVLVTNDGGSPAAGVQVTASMASGSGTLEGNTSATTDAAGVARFGDLGISGTGSHTLEFTAGAASVTSSPVEISALPPEATSGEWGPLVSWDIVPLHMNLMPNGKILAWGKTDAADTMGMPRIWDPASGPPSGLPMIDVDTMLFCAGHVLMPDGRLMVAGGHLQDDRGIATTFFFDQNGSPQRGPDMAHGRWYPTLTILPDGRILSMGGRNEAGSVVRTPEIFEGGQWVELPGAGSLEIPYYPRNFVPPNGPPGRIFYAGERIMSRWFDVDGTGAGGGRGAWSNGPSHLYEFNREYGTAVMYEPGKILYAGGGGHTGWGQSPDPKDNVPTATAEKIDLNQSGAQWESAGSMSAPRRHLNSTILPDGQVLITGGTRGGGFVNIDPGLAVREAEVWNPETDEWTTLASNSKMRVYHSVSLLLPDGTVLHGASGDAMAGTVPVPPERNHEIFSPPYLFKGARPTITSAPPTVSYGQVFSVVTPNAAQITEVRWIRLGTVTHAFDMGQRANRLTFAATATGVEVTAPDNANLAPAGHYLLFVLNRNGVPSEGKIVQVQ